MEDVRGRKREIRSDILKKFEALSESELLSRNKTLEGRLFEFANFLEANIVLLYISRMGEFNTKGIIEKSLRLNKVIVLPAFNADKHTIKLMKVDNPATDLIPGPTGILEPDPIKCKVLPSDCIDIAIIPGIAFDEKGGRLGTGDGYYDRFIPNLPMTTRKVSLVFENQIVSQIPMESHDKHVDIIITDERTIYKI